MIWLLMVALATDPETDEHDNACTPAERIEEAIDKVEANADQRMEALEARINALADQIEAENVTPRDTGEEADAPDAAPVDTGGAHADAAVSPTPDQALEADTPPALPVR